MSLQPEQLYALTVMGIPVWNQRSIDTSEQQDLASTTAVEMTLNPASNCLLLTGSSELPSLQTRLLAAMLQAVNVDLTQVTWLNSSQIDVVNMTELNGQVMLVFGEDVAQQLAAKYPSSALTSERGVAVLPALAAILAQPSLKQQAWSVLKVIQSRIQLYS